jgi:hypothetical protein
MRITSPALTAERDAIRDKEAPMSSRTVYISRLLGVFMLIFAAGEITHRATIVETATALIEAPALLWITGMMTVVAGLALVFAHNVWRGGVLPVVVTIIGWVMTIKGAALLIFPSSTWIVILHNANYAAYFPFYVAVSLFLGAYLTVAGFAAGGSRGN